MFWLVHQAVMPCSRNRDMHFEHCVQYIHTVCTYTFRCCVSTQCNTRMKKLEGWTNPLEERNHMTVYRTDMEAKYHEPQRCCVVSQKRSEHSCVHTVSLWIRPSRSQRPRSAIVHETFILEMSSKNIAMLSRTIRALQSAVNWSSIATPSIYWS